MSGGEEGSIASAYEAFAARAAASEAQATAACRAAFEARTGAFGPDDRWFDVRSQAFWDDALTSGGLAGLVALGEAEVAIAAAFGRAYRGLFRVGSKLPGTRPRTAYALTCAVTGISLVAAPSVPGAADALARADGLLFDGRVVAAAGEAVLLPGAIFHPEAATDAILAVVEGAGDLPRDDLLDALLRMELRFLSLSRVKASYAYAASYLAPRTNEPVGVPTKRRR